MVCSLGRLDQDNDQNNLQLDGEEAGKDEDEENPPSHAKAAIAGSGARFVTPGIPASSANSLVRTPRPQSLARRHSLRPRASRPRPPTASLARYGRNRWLGGTACDPGPPTC